MNTERHPKKMLERGSSRILVFVLSFFLTFGIGWAAYQFQESIWSAPPPPENFSVLTNTVIPTVAAPATTAVAPPGMSASPIPRVPRPPSSPRASPGTDDLPVPNINPQSQWVLRGRVINLLTLQPCANAHLVVKTSRTGTNSGSVTAAILAADAKGRYLTTLARLGSDRSYYILAADVTYDSSVFYEPSVDYARLPAAKRRQLAAYAGAGDTEGTTLTDIPGETSLHRDLFIVPKTH